MPNLELQQKDLSNAEHEQAKRHIENMGFTGIETHEDAELLIKSLQSISRGAAQYRRDNPGRDREYEDR